MTDKRPVVKSYQLSKSFASLSIDNEEDTIGACVKRALNLIAKAENVPPSKEKILECVRNDLMHMLQGESAEFAIGPYEATEMPLLRDEQVLPYLYHRYRYTLYPSQHKIDDYPPCIQIEPASICNFRCYFCYQSDKSFSNKASGHMGFMPLDRFKRVIDQIADNVEFVTLASRGEPLLAPDFSKMMAYTQDKFISLKVNTNASRLDEKRSHAILSSGVNTLVFSVDAADSKLYKTLRIKGDYNTTRKNIEQFQTIKQHHYPDSRIVTRISGVLVDRERQDIDQMRKTWGGLVDQVSFVNYSPWERIYEAKVNDIVKPCSDLWRRMFVWFDGRVSPCDNDYKAKLATGNLCNQTISDIWTGEKYQKLRDAHLQGRRKQYEPCCRCIVF